MIVQKFMTCNYMRKDVTVDFYILYNVAVRRLSYVDIYKLYCKNKKLKLNNILRFMTKMVYIIFYISNPYNSTKKMNVKTSKT